MKSRTDSRRCDLIHILVAITLRAPPILRLVSSSEEQIEESLAGNLCRCTGYRPIMDAFRVFAKIDDAMYSYRASNANGGFVCPSTGKPCSCGETNANHKSNPAESATSENGYKQAHFSYSKVNGSLHSENELIFPPKLLLRKNRPLKLSGFGGLKWFRPLKLQEVLELKSRYPYAKIVVGNTEVGIEVKFKNLKYGVIISATHVRELNALSVNEDGLEIGAAMRLSELQKVLKKLISERNVNEISACKAIVEQLKWFAGKQIRNVSSVGGNICNASPISDLNPLWMAARAKFWIIDINNKIRTISAEHFFLGYRKVDLAPNEILLSVFLPWTCPFEFVKEFKQAHRRDDDIAIVTAGMSIFLEDIGGKWVVSDASIAYGGVAPVTLLATGIKTFLIGKAWDQELLQGGLEMLAKDIALKEDTPGGMVEFRQSLTLSFFFKIFLWVSHQMEGEESFKEHPPLTHLSAIQSYHRPPSKGSQEYEMAKLGTAVGSPSVHLSARLQVTGEAEYCDDVPTPPNTLHAALVLSQKAHAHLLSIDDSAARSSLGFQGFFSSKDVPGSNNIGPVIQDEELFASKFVTCVGLVIGVVVADTHENARQAGLKVNVEYEELPAVISITDALKSNSFHPNTERWIRKGDVESCFHSGACDRILEGDVQVAGQEHFYLEPHSNLVWTLDGGHEVHIISSTQNPQNNQNYVARVLNLPLSKITSKTKRIGGGFGGRETRSGFLTAAASVPSYLLKRPVKIVLDRDTNTQISGQRHSFLGKYKVGFTNEGKLLELDIELYNNGGNSLDLSWLSIELFG